MKEIDATKPESIKLRAARLELKCLELIEGTTLSIRDVVRFKDTKHILYYPIENYELDSLEIAIEVVDGQPVWEPEKEEEKTVVIKLSIPTAEYYAGKELLVTAELVKTSMEEMQRECKKALDETIEVYKEKCPS